MEGGNGDSEATDDCDKLAEDIGLSPGLLFWVARDAELEEPFEKLNKGDELTTWLLFWVTTVGKVDLPFEDWKLRV